MNFGLYSYSESSPTQALEINFPEPEYRWSQESLIQTMVIGGMSVINKPVASNVYFNRTIRVEVTFPSAVKARAALEDVAYDSMPYTISNEAKTDHVAAITLPPESEGLYSLYIKTVHADDSPAAYMPNIAFHVAKAPTGQDSNKLLGARKFSKDGDMSRWNGLESAVWVEPVDPPSVPEYTDESYFTFSNGRITEYSASGPKDVVIPPTIGGEDVLILDESSFAPDWENLGLTSVIIPNGVTEIGMGAFYENPLGTVIIPDSVTFIDEDAFAGTGLSEIIIPPNITNIGGFAWNLLPSVTIPNTVVEIADYAFNDNLITEFVIPPQITSIGARAFATNSLTTITIPSTLQTLGEGCFAVNDLVSCNIEAGGITIIPGDAFTQNAITGTLVIPEGVTEIQYQAFYLNQITALNLPSTLRTLGVGAFRDNSLTSVDLKGVVSISQYAFTGNTITSYTIGAGCSFTDAMMGNNGTGLLAAYTSGGAGTYTYSGGWSKTA